MIRKSENMGQKDFFTRWLNRIRWFISYQAYRKFAFAKLGLLPERAEAEIYLPMWKRTMVFLAKDPQTTLLSKGDSLEGYGMEQCLIRYLMRNLKTDDVFYDVGANYGLYSVVASTIIKNGETHAFEANRDIFGFLTRNNGGTNCINNNVAISDKLGKMDFYVDVNASGFSSAYSDVISGKKKKTTVDVTTIDEYAKTHNPPTFIKMDIEGGELDAIRGAKRTINRYKPLISLEVWGLANGIKYSLPAVKELISMEYTPFALNSKGDETEIDPETVEERILNKIDDTENILFKPKR